MSIYRGRAESLEINTPHYAEYIGYLVGLRKKYLPFFTDGEYDMLAGEYPEQIKGAQYTFGEKTIAALWNDSDGAVSVLNTEIAPQGVLIKEFD